LKKNLLTIAITIFILTSATALADNNEKDISPKDISPIGSINFTDRVVYILDHTSDPDEGNWITIGYPDEERGIQLPRPIKITYRGPKSIEYGGVSGTLNKHEEESYTITYPSTSIYCTLPIYLPGENINVSFYGDSSLKGDVEICLFNMTSESVYGILDALKAGDAGNLTSLFHNNMDGNYKKYSTILGTNGDLLDYNLGPLDAGQYCIVIVQENENGSLTTFSATAFVVTEHKLSVSSPPYIVKGENLDINMELEDSHIESDCTYGAVLIREKAYKANIKIDCDGTRNGTSVIVNEMNLIDEFDLDSSNYRSKLTKNELQTEIQTLIGEGKGSIAIGGKGQKSLSLTAFDLPPDSYYLFVGAYSPEKGLVGLTQTEVEIKSKGSSGGKGKNKNKYSENNREPEINIRIKEQCKQFVTKNSQIRFEFTKSDTCVNYINFYSKKTTETTVTTIEELKEKSFMASTKPEGEVYNNFNIKIGDGTFENPNNLKNAIIGFKVDKTWITENRINVNSIILQHYSGEIWNPLSTKKVDEDKDYIYFEASTPNFSPFAITARTNIMAIEETGETQRSSELKTSNKPSSDIGSNMISQGNKNQEVSKIFNFVAGFFIIIILIGVLIVKKMGSK